MKYCRLFFAAAAAICISVSAAAQSKSFKLGQWVEIQNSILKELNRVNGSLSLNRIGSNPLEHLFGLVRMKSHSVHTFDKMLQVMSKSVLQSKLLRDIGENQKVDKRQSYFAHDVVNRPDAITTVLNGQPRDIAFILHCVLGLPIATNNLMLKFISHY